MMKNAKNTRRRVAGPSISKLTANAEPIAQSQRTSEFGLRGERSTRHSIDYFVSALGLGTPLTKVCDWAPDVP
jgi:hypothetical protein